MFFSIGYQINEVLKVHRGISGKAANAEAARLLDKVGIPEPESRLKQYPFQLSGGMRRRAMIAMALASEPRLLIAGMSQQRHLMLLFRRRFFHCLLN